MRPPDPNFVAAKTDTQSGATSPIPSWSFSDWLNYGITNYFCGTIVCYNHDGVPMTKQEEECDEPCVPIIRIYDTKNEKIEVENNHSPSIWRQNQH